MYQTVLNDKAWIDAYQLAEWLNIQAAKINVSGMKASIKFGDIKFTFKESGVVGNSYQIEYISGGVATSEVVTSTNSKLTIQIEVGVTTAQNILDALASFASIVGNELFVDYELIGLAGNAQNARPLSNLMGGFDPDATNVMTVKKLERFCNFACDKIQALIDAPVLPQTFTEEQDGSNSNVIVPSHWPVQVINFIKIDYNRNFDDPTKLDLKNYFLRGTPDKRQRVTDTAVRIMGSDVVLRDDNEKYIAGKIFAGSSIGSIQMEYVAGWCSSSTRTINGLGITEVSAPDLPQDMVLAALQLAEFFYYQRENKDIGVSSKGVMGESYNKLTDGIPNQIHELIAQYVDCSFGTHNLPQRNVWGL